MSTIHRLRARFSSLVEDLVKLSNEVGTSYFETRTATAIFMVPSYYWAERTTDQKARHLTLTRTYEEIIELLSMLLSKAPKPIEDELKEADRKFRMWLEFASNWSLVPHKHENEKNIRSSALAVEGLLDVLESGKTDQTIVVPDTNSLLWHPDPVSYREPLGLFAFEFLLLPTVLAELDELKILHRNPDVREKANQVIRRIKGWRHQGSLPLGVLLNKSITVRAEHREPNMAATLSWLDSENSDDKIVASVLAVQAAFPNARVLLATHDINLQNKADAAMIEIAEIENV